MKKECKNYIEIFIDKEYPSFIDKYLNVKTLKRLKYITQFCGCDYTKIYNTRFLFTRFDHSLVVAHMVWHFTHDKKATIIALLHDVGTPCFAHTIDFVLGDYLEQESSEVNIIDLINKDEELKKYLKEDNVSIDDLSDLSKYPILENKSPKLCCDRLDGVLHTCYIWIQTHELEDIKEVFNDLIVLENEQGIPEIGFQNKNIALRFVKMTSIYALELQSNRSKYVTQYISETIKKAFNDKLLIIDDLYKKKEIDIVKLLEKNIDSWNDFSNSTHVIGTNNKPYSYYVSLETKKRNVIPLVKISDGNIRINKILKEASRIYNKINNYKSKKYSYIKNIKSV